MDTGHELWPTGTHPHPIPSAPFSGMLVHLCHSQTPWCHPQPCQLAIWNGISTCISIPTVSCYQHMVIPLGLPHPYFPFPSLAAPANTLVSLQLIKATVLAESSLYFIFSPGSLQYNDAYRHESSRCHTLPFFLTDYFTNYTKETFLAKKMAKTPIKQQNELNQYFKFSVWIMWLIIIYGNTEGEIVRGFSMLVKLGKTF